MNKSLSDEIYVVDLTGDLMANHQNVPLQSYNGKFIWTTKMKQSTQSFLRISITLTCGFDGNKSYHITYISYFARPGQFLISGRSSQLL